MSLQGVNISIRPGTSRKSVKGLAGVSVGFEPLSTFTNIRVVDGRGRGINNAEVTATNPILGISSSSFTDSGGNTQVEVENDTPLIVRRNKFEQEYVYNNLISQTIVLMKNMFQ